MKMAGFYVLLVYNMTSPFAKQNNTFVLYLEPILNSYTKTYQNVITVGSMPQGPISEMVIPMSMPKLSEFQEAGVFSGNMGTQGNCKLVLLRYPKGTGKSSDSFMGADDIPSVFSYLLSNGYNIDSTLTKLLIKSPSIGNGISDTNFSGYRRLIAMVTYVV
jgi:hypothetical protein